MSPKAQAKVIPISRATCRRYFAPSSYSSAVLRCSSINGMSPGNSESAPRIVASQKNRAAEPDLAGSSRGQRQAAQGRQSGTAGEILPHGLFSQFPLVIEMPARGHSPLLDLDVIGQQVERHHPTGMQARIGGAEQFRIPDHHVAGRVLGVRMDED